MVGRGRETIQPWVELMQNGINATHFCIKPMQNVVEYRVYAGWLLR